MKLYIFALITALSILGSTSIIYAQGTDKTLKRIETPIFKKTLDNPSFIYIPMGFNTHDAAKKISEIDAKNVESVALVYTQYRSSERFDQLTLNERRTYELLKLMPSLAKNKSIKWYWIAQTDCSTPARCKDLFHGFEIRLKSKELRVGAVSELYNTEYYTKLHLSEAAYKKHLDSLRKVAPKSVIEVCDTTYSDFCHAQYRAGLFKPKSHKSRKKIIKLWNKNIDKNLNQFSFSLNNKNKLEEFIGIRDRNTQFFLDMKRLYSISGARVYGKRVDTRYTVNLNRTSKGKITNFSIVAEPIESNGNAMNIREHSLEYRRVITCSLVDTASKAPTSNYVLYDNVVTEVLDRNTSWKKCLVATDVTGSMYSYIGQFLAWHKLNLNSKGQNFDFVFFNDGDNMPDEWKKPGKVGGTYYVHTKNYYNIQKYCIMTQKRGGGGDGPENNIEAILFGLKKNPSLKEVILIADNYATPRDLELLSKVKVPIHVILCGANTGINIMYLNMVRENGGTLHTIEEDLLELAKVNEGESVTINGVKYTIKSGKFVIDSSKSFPLSYSL